MFDPLVVAQASPHVQGEAFPYWVLIPVCAALVLFSFLMLLLKRYKRCRSDQVLVIFGKVGGGNTSRCVHGGAAFVWPLIQDHAYLSLEPDPIAVPLQGAHAARQSRR